MYLILMYLFCIRPFVDMLITLFDIGITPGLLFAFGMVEYDTHPDEQLKPW